MPAVVLGIIRHACRAPIHGGPVRLQTMLKPKHLRSALHGSQGQTSLSRGFLTFPRLNKNPTAIDHINHSACDCSPSVL